MMTTIWYDGAEPTGPYAGFVAGIGTTMDATGHQHGEPTPDVATSAPSATSQTGTGEKVEIAMVDDRFDPSTATVPVGTTVTWVNNGENWHSIASFDGSFESGKIQPGERYSYQFTQAGSYQYICKHHGMQGMLGTVIVEAASG
jgi:plastocyanin